MKDVLAVLLDQSTKMGRDFTKVPSFLKHADRDRDALMAYHCDTVHLTMSFAIRQWVELGNRETELMQKFSQLCPTRIGPAIVQARSRNLLKAQSSPSKTKRSGASGFAACPI